MDAAAFASALKMQLMLMRERLHEAAGLGQAAEACAKAGNAAKLSKLRSISNS